MTKWIDRLIAALTLLCGEPPPLDLVWQWENFEDDPTKPTLQDWAAAHAKLGWAQGIAVIEAAQHLANNPEEGMGHAPKGVADHVVESTD